MFSGSPMIYDTSQEVLNQVCGDGKQGKEVGGLLECLHAENQMRTNKNMKKECKNILR